MGQEESATQSHEARKNKASLGRNHALGLHSPFEYTKESYYDLDNAMGQDNSI